MRAPLPRTADSHRNGRYGRMRSRAVGRPVAGVPEVVLVQGLGAAKYLLPALAELGGWTRAHLLELPGLAGSGEPPHEMDLADYAGAVADWLDRRADDTPVVLAGHSAGCQVAARAAVGHPRVAGLVLASPTMEPVRGGLLGLAWRWQRNGMREAPGLTASHRHEWRRAGLLRLLRYTRHCLADRIENAVRRLDVPMLVVYGRGDLISREPWVRRLVATAADGRLARVPGAHTFVWSAPSAWSEPVRAFVTGLPAATPRPASGRSPRPAR